MSSPRFSIVRAYPDALKRRIAAAVDGWVRRRGPTHPPLVLRYRQIFILPTAFGWLIGLLLFAMMMGSLNFNNNLGLLTTFLVSGMALLSMHVAYRNLEGLGIEGCSTEPVFAGQQQALRVALRESAGRARSGIVCAIVQADPSGGVDLARDGTARAELQLPTARRGRFPIDRIRVRTRHPLGLFEAWSWAHPRETRRVWPRPADPAPPLPTRSGATRTPRPGDESDEFHGLRDWREGDPLHRIAWKASTRHDQLLARQFTQPSSGRNVFRLQDVPAADLETRLSILCRWVLEAERQGMEYGLDLGHWNCAPSNGEAHRNRCLDALADYA